MGNPQLQHPSALAARACACNRDRPPLLWCVSAPHSPMHCRHPSTCRLHMQTAGGEQLPPHLPSLAIFARQQPSVCCAGGCTLLALLTLCVPWEQQQCTGAFHTTGPIHQMCWWQPLTLVPTGRTLRLLMFSRLPSSQCCCVKQARPADTVPDSMHMVGAGGVYTPRPAPTLNNPHTPPLLHPGCQHNSDVRCCELRVRQPGCMLA